jgi:Na+-translocating ferredoxin:NAD+ oxidoreductase RNF subunit RnfB
MSHHTAKDAYYKLQERLNRFPQGAPPSATLYKILELLFSKREAELISQLPIKPFTAKDAARIWKLSEAEATKVLEALASRAILVDADWEGITRYTLPPPMAGFFEFSMMRTRGDIDQKLLRELYYQYLNVEEDFIKDLLLGSETRMGRVFVQEEVLSGDNAIHILDFERASEVIKTASHIGIGMCYCRHKMQHIGKACDAPMDICMTFNGAGTSLIKAGFAREVDVVEGMELLHQAYENNLVQCGENVRQGVNFICNCCSCCCEFLVAARKYGATQAIHTSNFITISDDAACVGCGKCITACPVDAITWAEDGTLNAKNIRIDESVCLGCGVCVRSCPTRCLSLSSRKEKIITPINSVHRVVLMAIEKGKLQNLLFDSHAFASHRALAAILGVILKLPPVKQAMASRQMKSIYLEKLASRIKA